MSKKKIEPTDAMVDAVEFAREFVALDARSILRAGLNHPDAAELFADEDARPWEPLNGPANVGDEVRRDHCGIITTGVVARVDEDGDPFTVEGYLIGLRDYGAWYVRRAAQELPTEKGAVIVRKGERIEARHAGKTWVAIEAALVDGEWRGPWLEKGRTIGGFNAMWAMDPDHIIPGTWKVADQ